MLSSLFLCLVISVCWTFLLLKLICRNNLRPEMILSFAKVDFWPAACVIPGHDQLTELQRVGRFGLTRCLEASMLLTPQVQPVRSQFTNRVVHKDPRRWRVLNQCFSCGHKRLSEPWFTLSALCSQQQEPLGQSGPRCGPHVFGFPFFPGVWQFLTILIGVLCLKDMFFSASGFICFLVERLIGVT